LNSFNIVKTTNIFENVDTRTKERGLACKSFHKLPLVEILLKYNYKDPAIEKSSLPKQFNKKDPILNYLLEKDIVKKGDDLTRLENYTLEKLQYVYRYSDILTKEELCRIINVIFAQNNLLLIF
jgi:hypothetical protein